MSRSYQDQDQDQGPSRAIALYYDQISAPKVVAKGSGGIAEKMIEIAREHGVHLHEDPQLLQQLACLELGDEIPLQLYRVIAEIIAFVYWLEGKQPASEYQRDDYVGADQSRSTD